MRGKIISIFAGILWLLAACTILSAKIEQLMVAKVITAESKSWSKEELTLPFSALVTDEDGAHLYQVEDGGEWNTGKIAQEVNPGSYSMEADCVRILNGTAGVFIQYASKSITQGDRVQVVKASTQEDMYLIVNENGADWTEESLKNASSDGKEVQMSEQAALLLVNGSNPFIESQVRESLHLSEDDHIYSLQDVQMFGEAIWYLAWTGAILLFFFIIWIYSCRMAGKQKWLWGNGVVGVLLIGCLYAIVGRVDLPASLLPAKNILRAEYYSKEFSAIKQGLESVSGQQAEAVLRALSHSERMAVGILAVTLAAAVAVILLENKKIK